MHYSGLQQPATAATPPDLYKNYIPVSQALSTIQHYWF